MLTNFAIKWDNISVVPALLTLPNFFSLSLSPMQEFGYRCCIVLNIRITLDFNSRGRNITVYRIQVIFLLLSYNQDQTMSSIKVEDQEHKLWFLILIFNVSLLCHVQRVWLVEIDQYQMFSASFKQGGKLSKICPQGRDKRRKDTKKFLFRILSIVSQNAGS